MRGLEVCYINNELPPEIKISRKVSTRSGKSTEFSGKPDDMTRYKLLKQNQVV